MAAQIAAIALGVSATLDEDRAQLYVDLILNSLSEAAREVLETMRPYKHEYMSDFARGYVGQGRAEGEIQGRVTLVTRQLAARFGSLSDEVKTQIASKTLEELDAIGDRLLIAANVEVALGPNS